MYLVLSNFLLAKIGFDAAENEPFKVCWYLLTNPPPSVINTALLASPSFASSFASSAFSSPASGFAYVDTNFVTHKFINIAEIVKEKLNFRQFALGCIKMNVSNQRLILQNCLSSTQLFYCNLQIYAMLRFLFGKARFCFQNVVDFFKIRRKCYRFPSEFHTKIRGSRDSSNFAANFQKVCRKVDMFWK